MRVSANLGARQAAAVYDALDGDSARFFADCLQVGADEAGREVGDGLGKSDSVRRAGGRVSGTKCGRTHAYTCRSNAPSVRNCEHTTFSMCKRAEEKNIRGSWF